MKVFSESSRYFDTASNGVVTKGFYNDEITEFMNNSVYQGILTNMPYVLTLDCRDSSSQFSYIVICFDTEEKAISALDKAMREDLFDVDFYRYAVRIKSRDLE